MDSQHQHVPADPSDHYGFLSYRPGERIDPVAEKRMILGLFSFSGSFSLFSLPKRLEKPKKPERPKRQEKLFNFPDGSCGGIF